MKWVGKVQRKVLEDFQKGRTSDLLTLKVLKSGFLKVKQKKERRVKNLCPILNIPSLDAIHFYQSLKHDLL